MRTRASTKRALPLPCPNQISTRTTPIPHVCGRWAVKRRLLCCSPLEFITKHEVPHLGIFDKLFLKSRCLGGAARRHRTATCSHYRNDHNKGQPLLRPPSRQGRWQLSSESPLPPPPTAAIGERMHYPDIDLLRTKKSHTNHGIRRML